MRWAKSGRCNNLLHRCGSQGATGGVHQRFCSAKPPSFGGSAVCPPRHITCALTANPRPSLQNLIWWPDDQKPLGMMDLDQGRLRVTCYEQKQYQVT